jgi:hypothetical protein
MDQATCVEWSDKIKEAASFPREEELLGELDGKVKTIAEVLNGVKAAVSALPDIQDDMEQIKSLLALSDKAGFNVLSFHCTANAEESSMQPYAIIDVFD